MVKHAVLATGFLAAIVSFQARAQVAGGSFDVLGSVMETHNNEINAHNK